MSDEVDLLKRVYDRFNARDMETLLAAMHEDVIWANGMEGGHVHGRDEVRSYRTHQWTISNSAALRLASFGPRMFQRHEVLRADDGQFTRSAAWPPEIHSILEKNLTAGKAKPMQCSLLVAKHGKGALRRVLRSFVLNDVQISARSRRIRANPAILRVARRIQS